jgi:hypothetical protein
MEKNNKLKQKKKKLVDKIKMVVKHELLWLSQLLKLGIWKEILIKKNAEEFFLPKFQNGR